MCFVTTYDRPKLFAAEYESLIASSVDRIINVFFIISVGFCSVVRFIDIVP